MVRHTLADREAAACLIGADLVPAIINTAELSKTRG